MLYVINAAYGGFCVPDEVTNALGCDRYTFYYADDIRTDETLIAWVREHRNDEDNELALVNIPENATDWELNEYDGFESIVAVVDGKIVHLGAWDGVE